MTDITHDLGLTLYELDEIKARLRRVLAKYDAAVDVIEAARGVLHVCAKNTGAGVLLSREASDAMSKMRGAIGTYGEVCRENAPPCTDTTRAPYEGRDLFRFSPPEKKR